MNERKCRVAVIGLGRIGALLETDPYREKPASHLGSWLANPKCKVVGLCDSIGVVPSLVDATGAKAYTDYQKMLTDVKADIVSIATPDETHRKIARDAMGYENVKLIWLEKPIAKTVSEADDIISRAREFKVKVAINHTRRWSPIWQHAAKLCAEDRPTKMIGTFGGDLYREGSHMADLFNWMDAKQQIVNGFWHSEAPNYLIWEVDLFWKDKRIRITENGRISRMYQSFPSKHYDDHIQELQKTCEVRRNLYPQSDMYLATTQLVSCLEEDTDPLCDALTGKKALELVEKWAHSGDVGDTGAILTIAKPPITALGSQ